MHPRLPSKLLRIFVLDATSKEIFAPKDDQCRMGDDVNGVLRSTKKLGRKLPRHTMREVVNDKLDVGHGESLECCAALVVMVVVWIELEY